MALEFKYEASSLEDIAMHFESLAQRAHEKSKSHAVSQELILHAQRDTWAAAARILRNTTLKGDGNE